MIQRQSLYGACGSSCMVAILFALCSATCNPAWCGDGKLKRKITPVSLARLLSADARLEGKQVRFEGFLSLDFEGEAIYLSEADYRHEANLNAIYLDLSDEQKHKLKPLSFGYVLVEGTYHMDGFGDFGGSVNKVTRLERETVDYKGPLPPLPPPK